MIPLLTQGPGWTSQHPDNFLLWSLSKEQKCIVSLYTFFFVVLIRSDLIAGRKFDAIFFNDIFTVPTRAPVLAAIRTCRVPPHPTLSLHIRASKTSSVADFQNTHINKYNVFRYLLWYKRKKKQSIEFWTESSILSRSAFPSQGSLMTSTPSAWSTRLAGCLTKQSHGKSCWVHLLSSN